MSRTLKEKKVERAEKHDVPSTYINASKQKKRIKNVKNVSCVIKIGL